MPVTTSLRPCISACKEKERLGVKHGICATCAQELRDESRALLASNDELLAALKTAERERNEARADLHLLKRAVSPSRAGDAPWEGMPDITYFVGVALRMRERETKVTIEKAAGLQ